MVVEGNGRFGVGEKHSGVFRWRIVFDGAGLIEEFM